MPSSVITVLSTSKHTQSAARRDALAPEISLPIGEDCADMVEKDLDGLKGMEFAEVRRIARDVGASLVRMRDANIGFGLDEVEQSRYRYGAEK